MRSATRDGYDELNECGKTENQQTDERLYLSRTRTHCSRLIRSNGRSCWSSLLSERILNVRSNTAR